jgi:nucleotide-binding universal stress UspA family protein
MQPIKTILYATDFSKSSEVALDMARGLARGFGARLVALHVGARPFGSVGGVMTAPPPQPEEFGREELERKLGKFVAGDSDARCEPEVIFGEPSAEIVQAADRLKADLVVIGTHGRTGLHRHAMGSLAEQVLRLAPCPVIVVRDTNAK